MKIQEGNFRSSTDGWKIHYYALIPNEGMKAVMLLAHGMYEKAMRYRSFMEFLCRNGYGVYSLDHRGHGESANRGIGDLGDGDVYLKMIRDMRTLHQMIKKEWPRHKLVLFGHSMGSFLAQRYIQIYPRTIDALILSGSGGKDQVSPAKLGKGVAYSLKTIGRSKKQSLSMFVLQLQLLSMKIPKRKSMYDWICSDGEVLTKYRKDNQLGIPYTVNSYYYIYKGISENFQRSTMQVVNKRLPILLVSGSQDPIGNFGKGVHALARWYGSFNMDDVECKLYEGMRHEVLNEPGKEIVMNDILNWIRKHI